MADLEIEIDEYCLFYEYVQGNAFNGLEYYDLIEEEFDLTHSVYHVWNDFIEEEINFTEAFTPYHYLVLKEAFNYEEQFGLPIQVSATSLEVMHEQKVRPIDIAFFSLEVLHGVDIFWEEVSSGLHSTEYTQGVPYHFFENIDYLGLDITATVVKVNFAQSLDRLNMRHEVIQFYNFNNIVLEQFFIYDWLKIAWNVRANDFFDIYSYAAHYLGFTAYDFLIIQDINISNWIGAKYINETIFSWDLAKQVQGYSDLLIESLDLVELLKAPYFDKIISSLIHSDNIELTNMITTQIINDALKIQATVIIALQYLLMINDPLSYLDTFTLSNVVRDYALSIEDGFSINVNTVSNFLIYRIIEDAISGTDSGLINIILSANLEDSIAFTEEIN